MSFSIYDDEWIPARYLSGKSKLISLRQAFFEADKIKWLNSNFEMTNLGIFRLLCVFYMEAYKPEDVYERKEHFEESQFDISILDTYVKNCQNVNPGHDCFDIFDDSVPFLQTADIDANIIKKSPVSRINDFDSSGEELTFFTGKAETDYEYTPEKCAQALAQKLSTFIKNGGEGFLSFPPIMNAIFMIRKEKTLKDSIILNSMSVAEWNNFSGDMMMYGCEDNTIGAMWKQKRHPWKKGEKIHFETSLAFIMTFMPVHIKLILDCDGLVRNILYASKKFDIKEISTYKDPMTVMEKVQGTGIAKGKEFVKPAQLDPSVGCWEVFDALQSENGRNLCRPYTLEESRKFPKWTGIRTWSPCKNGKGKGIIFYDEFSINEDAFDLADTVKNDVMCFNEIIDNFSTKNIKLAFSTLLNDDKFGSKCILEIKENIRLYMNSSYIEFLAEYGKKEKGAEKVQLKEKYTLDTLNAMRVISLSYLKKFPDSVRHLKGKIMCEKEIEKYFAKQLKLLKLQ